MKKFKSKSGDGRSTKMNATDDLKSLMKRHERATLKEFHENGGVGPPKWLLEDKFGTRLLVMTPLDSDDMAKVARQVIKEFGAVRYAFCMESWFLKPKEHEGLNIPPSQHPLRHEGVFLSGENIKGDRLVISYEIKRREGAKPWLEKMSSGDGADLTGVLTDMFAVGPYL
jgi:hypothetical protein